MGVKFRVPFWRQQGIHRQGPVLIVNRQLKPLHE